MTAIGGELFRQVLHNVLLLYALVVMTHFVLQVSFAHQAYRAARRARDERPEVAATPPVDVIVTSYNEEPDRLEACLQSVRDQDYEGEIRVVVVDDCSANRAELLPIYERFAAFEGWEILLAKENRGKRAGQDVAFRHSGNPIVVTIDSDTEVDPDGVTEIVRAFDDERVGAVTGDVGVTNERQNLLTRLIGKRYWVAFNQERAAQSRFRAVLCCSGPLAGYRRTVLARIWERYVTQTYRGIECTYGDDRHLTNLVLETGHDTLFLPFAHAVTYAPENLRSYLRQQLRWNKSFYRELLWTLPFLLRCSPYLVFEVLVQTVLPLLLTLAIATAFVLGVADDPHRLVRYAEVIVVMALLRCCYAVYRTKSLSFLVFVLYGFVHVVFLVPTRLRALFTLGDNSWGTRTAAQTS
jgi:hyaluronan synthase/N-acetylglucosaminyltransferase